MRIDKKTVKYVADLARIEVDEKESGYFAGQLGRILEYVNKLEKLDISGLEATTHVLGIKNVYREDKVKKSLSAAEAIQNAPSKEGDLFKVGKIIEP